MQKNNIRKHTHLLISTIIVIPIALVYGIFPKSVLPQLLDFTVGTTDLSNVFRATMCLYLAFASLWILGTVKPNYWKAATISNMLFMFGLAFGRMMSFILDGLPSTLFLYGTIGEFVLATFALYQWQQHKKHYI